MALAPSKPCPCFSGARYGDCCAPAHRGEREAPTPEALMRSRYAAFALGLGAYLVKTLSADHPDRAHDAAHGEGMLARELSRAKDRQRFLGLTIEESREDEDGQGGEVLFHARIFERGQDRSFRERSRFVREAGAWRYAGGEVDG